jgi:predicted AlkP superfamily pyrophosphatase or phosphodiesterase
MSDLTPTLLPRLKDHKLPGLNIENSLIHPKYDDQSIVNIPAAICKWMGIPEYRSTPLHQEITSKFPGDIRNVILILVDALSFSRFTDWMETNPVWKMLVQEGLLAPLTSVVPSTTSSALTSLWTGAYPSEHGVLGYEMWIKEFSMIANMILHAPITFKNSVDSLTTAGFSPGEFLGMQTFGTHLANHGVDSYSFTHYSIAKSGLSRMLMRDVEVQPFQTPASLWVSIRDLIETKSENTKFIWTYWGQVDGISHYNGPDDERVKAEFSHYSLAFEHFFLNQIHSQSKSDTMVILTADHGQTPTPLNSNMVLENHPELHSYLRMNPTCENRFTFLYTRPGNEDSVREYFSETWPDEFILITQEEAITKGLFGPEPYHPDLGNRVGDLIAISRDEAYLWWSKEQDFLLGRHGGMNSQDMLVPFLAVKL